MRVALILGELAVMISFSASTAVASVSDAATG